MRTFLALAAVALLAAAVAKVATRTLRKTLVSAFSFAANTLRAAAAVSARLISRKLAAIWLARASMGSRSATKSLDVLTRTGCEASA